VLKSSTGMELGTVSFDPSTDPCWSFDGFR